MIPLERFYCRICCHFVPSCRCASTSSSSSKAFCLDAETCALVVQSLSSSGYLLFSFSVESHALQIMQELHLHSSMFFSSPLELKMQSCSKDKARRGYSPLETENFAALVGIKDKPNDKVEKYRYGPVIDPSCLHSQQQYEGQHQYQQIDKDYFSSKAATVHFFPNPIENLDHKYQQALAQYYKLMEKLSLCVLYILEIAFDLETGSMVTPSMPPYHTSILSINHYPLDTELQPAVERVADHTDVSLFTIVTEMGTMCGADDAANPAKNTQLQMLDRNTNDWIDINLGPEEFLVNIGDYLQYISCGKLHSARHRVISVESGKIPRESFAYFCTPRYDAMIDWKQKDRKALVSSSDETPYGSATSAESNDSTTFSSSSSSSSDGSNSSRSNERYAQGMSYHEFRKAKISKVINSLKLRS